VRARIAAFAALALAAAAPALAAPDPTYLAQLAARSRELHLADTPQWRRLLHYHESWFEPGARGGADEPRFYLAEHGRRDAQAELDATLAAFFQPAPADPAREPAACAYIARYHWLSQSLGFDPRRLPPQPCERFRAWYQELDPSGISFVFPEAFLNNPASMFGHTLLRLDTAAGAGRHDLIAWAINFAGATGDDSGPLYVAKGVFGFYAGYYSIGPYYEKVKEYGDWERRDIWEYRLALTRAEIDLLLMHLWELQGIRFDYYYFDENCSWQLLGLLEVARPSLRLSERFPLWVIPGDSLRAVVEEAGLVGKAVYRPSATTQLRADLRRLSSRERALAKRIAIGDLAPDAPELAELDAPTRAAVLTIAYDELRSTYLAREVTREQSASRARAILVARSRVDVQGASFPPAETPRVAPHEGHGSARASLAGGFEDRRFYVEARIRPALHDLLDPQGGYTRGAEVQFLDTALRWYPEQDQVRLQELVALSLASLTPWDRFFEPWSWRFDTGIRTRLAPESGREDLDPEGVWRTHGGVGLALDLPRGALLYGFAEATFDVGPTLADDVAFGPGAAAGLLIPGDDGRWRGNFFAQATRFVAGDRTTWVRAGLEQSVAIGRHSAIELETAFERDFGQNRGRIDLRWNLDF
jgi:hypothetical protein